MVGVVRPAHVPLRRCPSSLLSYLRTWLVMEFSSVDNTPHVTTFQSRSSATHAMPKTHLNAPSPSTYGHLTLSTIINRSRVLSVILYDRDELAWNRGTARRICLTCIYAQPDPLLKWSRVHTRDTKRRLLSGHGHC